MRTKQMALIVVWREYEFQIEIFIFVLLWYNAVLSSTSLVLLLFQNVFSNRLEFSFEYYFETTYFNPNLTSMSKYASYFLVLVAPFNLLINYNWLLEPTKKKFEKLFRYAFHVFIELHVYHMKWFTLNICFSNEQAWSENMQIYSTYLWFYSKFQMQEQNI